ncbi:pollen receptor-like kinase 4 [Typha latifolia]|uniref:pollen receptor-like kinase 4 n=1 Tax=Typha latifolia TaxID=4733 RepID=UPI003C2D4348
MADRPVPWSLQLLTLGFSLTILLHATSHASEADVLLAFKKTLSSGGDGDALPNWVDGTKPCNQNVSLWTGVRCNIDGEVQGLQLENMTLSGNLSLDLLVGLPGLRALSVQNNSFEGPVPDFTKLAAIKMIYLSRNRFSGTIPDDMFAGMLGLRKVYLSHNEFTGPIPGSLTRLQKLLDLGLDYNRFDGKIPDLRQPGLLMVNVSYNNLEGPIPTRLRQFNANLFAGNKNLCGPPLDVPCSSPSSSRKISPTLLGAIIVIAIGVLLAIVGLVMVILGHRRRQQYKETQLGQPQSSKFKIQAKDDKLEGGASERYGGSKKAPKEEHGKLVFVREDRQRFEIEDLLRASAEVLGSGNFGSSYKASLFDGPSVVVKRFREMNGVGREDFQEHMRRMGRLSHPNLLPLVAYLSKKEEKLLVTDYVPNGSLAHMLHGNRGSNLPPLDWPTRLKVIRGVARGLAYLYEELPMLTVPHGHLKSSNVLLDDSYEPLLMDYALVPLMNQSHASQVMVAYKSPECAQHGKPFKKSDVWSLGILILEVLTGKFPTNYLRQGRAETDLASWVNSVVREEWTGEVFDKEMKRTKNGEGEMLKMLQVGLGCCEVDVEKRWELNEAVRKIEDLKEKGSDDEYSSFASEGEGRFSSKAMTEDDFSFTK